MKPEWGFLLENNCVYRVTRLNGLVTHKIPVPIISGTKEELLLQLEQMKDEVNDNLFPKK